MPTNPSHVNRLFAIASVIYAFTACDAPARTGQDHSALDSIRKEHVTAVNSRNAEGVLESMSEDVIYLAPEAPPISGRDSLESIIRPAYEQFQPKITMTPREVRVHGNVAVEWGCLGGELQPIGGGDPIPNQGKYLLVYERHETLGWKISKDVYNTGPCDLN